jgi:hypothetical protein
MWSSGHFYYDRTSKIIPFDLKTLKIVTVLKLRV